MNKIDLNQLLIRLGKNRFRRRFRLKGKDRKFAKANETSKLRHHAVEFIANRIAPANPENDGKQTPMKGHPVFVAQHATGTCCRSCLEKWMGIEQGRAISEEEQLTIVQLILEWIRRDLEKSNPEPEIEPDGEVQKTLFNESE